MCIRDRSKPHYRPVPGNGGQPSPPLRAQTPNFQSVSLYPRCQITVHCRVHCIPQHYRGLAGSSSIQVLVLNVDHGPTFCSLQGLCNATGRPHGPYLPITGLCWSECRSDSVSTVNINHAKAHWPHTIEEWCGQRQHLTVDYFLQLRNNLHIM